MTDLCITCDEPAVPECEHIPTCFQHMGRNCPADFRALGLDFDTEAS